MTTTPIKVDYSTALVALQQAVEERGANFKYRDLFGEGDCRYVIDGEPACLVGEVLVGLGTPIGAFAMMSPGERSGDINTVRIGAASRVLESGGLVEFSIDALNLLAAAQDFQDHGQTWGEALDAAVKGTALVAV